MQRYWSMSYCQVNIGNLSKYKFNVKWVCKLDHICFGALPLTRKHSCLVHYKEECLEYQDIPLF